MRHVCGWVGRPAIWIEAAEADAVQEAGCARGRHRGAGRIDRRIRRRGVTILHAGEETKHSLTRRGRVHCGGECGVVALLIGLPYAVEEGLVPFHGPAQADSVVVLLE